MQAAVDYGNDEANKSKISDGTDKYIRIPNQIQTRLRSGQMVYGRFQIL